ncbi:MAG TPA: alpha-glucosidase, partial [Bacteroides sp.]|nr:alpha-glucosidase [Bacteroides sp.]
DAPALAIDFMKEVPTTWDETVFLDGYPGKYCVLARRHGDRWYVVGVNSDNKPLFLKLDLSRFISQGREYKYYSDTKELLIQLKVIKALCPDKVEVTIQSNGGMVIVCNL